MKLWAMPCRATQDDGAWWSVLTKHGPLEKRMANHFSILALRTPWTIWQSKKIWHWKMTLWKCCTQKASKFGKLNSGHRTRQGHVSFQSQRKAMPKNAQTQQHLSHTLAKQCSKFSKPGFSNKWTMNFQMFKLVLEGRETRNQIVNICWIMEKAREFQKNIYFCFIDYAKAFGCVNHNKL